jgi:hypothetical protein
MKVAFESAGVWMLLFDGNVKQVVVVFDQENMI